MASQIVHFRPMKVLCYSRTVCEATLQNFVCSNYEENKKEKANKDYPMPSFFFILILLLVAVFLV